MSVPGKDAMEYPGFGAIFGKNRAKTGGYDWTCLF